MRHCASQMDRLFMQIQVKYSTQRGSPARSTDHSALKISQGHNFATVNKDRQCNINCPDVKIKRTRQCPLLVLGSVFFGISFGQNLKKKLTRDKPNPISAKTNLAQRSPLPHTAPPSSLSRLNAARPQRRRSAGKPAVPRCSPPIKGQTLIRVRLLHFCISKT